MEDFIPKNVKIMGFCVKGIIKQTLGDGRIRKIDCFNHTVTIENKYGNLLYFGKLKKSHPLIVNAYNQYHWNAIRRFSIKPTFIDILRLRLKKNEMKEKLKTCEVYYKIM